MERGGERRLEAVRGGERRRGALVTVVQLFATTGYRVAMKRIELSSERFVVVVHFK